MSAVTIKLADGQKYPFVRESPFSVQDSPIHDKLMAVNNLLDFSEQLDVDIKLRNAENTIGRMDTLIGVCQEHLMRKDIGEEKEQQWQEKLDQCYQVLEKAEAMQAEALRNAHRLTTQSRDLTMEVARWAIMKQHGKSEVEADCLLTDKLAIDVCATILGRGDTVSEETASPLSQPQEKSGDG